jgi:hypothetical protein
MLKISFKTIKSSMNQWHQYELAWLANSCSFSIDGDVVLKTRNAPRGPMAFVAWIDNQYLVATPTGRLKWGTLQITEQQSLSLLNLEITSFDSQ